MKFFKKITHPGKGGAERKTTQEAASTFLTVTSKRVYWLRRPRSPRSSSTAMDLVEWSARFLGIICLDVRVRIVGCLGRQTIVKNGTGAADRINSAPSEREGFGRTRLLTHDVRKEGRCSRGGDSGDFGRISSERGLDGI